MGYFSFTCAKTGLPIVSSDSGCDARHYEVVLLRPDNTKVLGSYDGYGRIDGGGDSDDDNEGNGHSIGDKGGSKLVLAHFHAGERYEQVGPCKHDPAQGAFDPIFHLAMMRAQELVPGFDGHQYIPRLHELLNLRSARNDFIESTHGFSFSSLWDLRQSVERLDYEEPGDRAAAGERCWREATKGFPNGEVPAGHLVHGRNVEESQAILDAECERLEMAYVTELVDAWCEARPTRVPNFEALASGVGQGLAGARRGVSRSLCPESAHPQCAAIDRAPRNPFST